MMNPDAGVEVRDGRLWVDRDPVPLRRGLVTAALARAGWHGEEGPVNGEFFEKLLVADRRISIYFFGSSTVLNSSEAELMQ